MEPPWRCVAGDWTGLDTGTGTQGEGGETSSHLNCHKGSWGRGRGEHTHMWSASSVVLLLACCVEMMVT